MGKLRIYLLENDSVTLFYQNDYENPMLAPFSLEYLITRLTANFYRK